MVTRWPAAAGAGLAEPGGAPADPEETGAATHPATVTAASASAIAAAAGSRARINVAFMPSRPPVGPRRAYPLRAAPHMPRSQRDTSPVHDQQASVQPHGRAGRSLVPGRAVNR